jgi:hypothetical protein
MRAIIARMHTFLCVQVGMLSNKRKKQLFPNLSTLSIGTHNQMRDMLESIVNGFISETHRPHVKVQEWLTFCMGKLTVVLTVEKLIAWLYIVMGKGLDSPSQGTPYIAPNMLNKVPLLSEVVDFYNSRGSEEIRFEDVLNAILNIFTENEYFYAVFSEEPVNFWHVKAAVSLDEIKRIVNEIVWPHVTSKYPYDSKIWDAILYLSKEFIVNDLRTQGHLRYDKIIEFIELAENMASERTVDKNLRSRIEIMRRQRLPSNLFPPNTEQYLGLDDTPI